MELHGILLLPRCPQSHCHSGCLENKTLADSGPEWAQKVLSQEMVLDQRRWQTKQEQLLL